MFSHLIIVYFSLQQSRVFRKNRTRNKKLHQTLLRWTTKYDIEKYVYYTWLPLRNVYTSRQKNSRNLLIHGKQNRRKINKTIIVLLTICFTRNIFPVLLITVRGKGRRMAENKPAEKWQVKTKHAMSLVKNALTARISINLIDDSFRLWNAQWNDVKTSSTEIGVIIDGDMTLNDIYILYKIIIAYFSRFLVTLP